MVRDETSLVFVDKAKGILELAIDKYSKLPRETVNKIQNVIDELENILEEEY